MIFVKVGGVGAGVGLTVGDGEADGDGDGEAVAVGVGVCAPTDATLVSMAVARMDNAEARREKIVRVMFGCESGRLKLTNASQFTS